MTTSAKHFVQEVGP